MEEWKKHILAGNKEFSSKNYAIAEHEYKVAKDYAEQSFIQWHDPYESSSALVVTYHNLADLHQRQGNTELARETLEDAHDILLRAVTSTPVDSGRHDALCQASLETYSALLLHKKSYGSFDQVH